MKNRPRIRSPASFLSGAKMIIGAAARKGSVGGHIVMYITHAHAFVSDPWRLCGLHESRFTALLTFFMVCIKKVESEDEIIMYLIFQSIETIVLLPL